MSGTVGCGHVTAGWCARCLPPAPAPGPGVADMVRLYEMAQGMFTRPAPSGPTVRVRIAVAVDEHGAWASCGWLRGGDARLTRHALDDLLNVQEQGAESRHVVFVEADVPLPTPVVVEGKPASGESA